MFPMRAEGSMTGDEEAVQRGAGRAEVDDGGSGTFSALVAVAGSARRPPRGYFATRIRGGPRPDIVAVVVLLLWPGRVRACRGSVVVSSGSNARLTRTGLSRPTSSPSSPTSNFHRVQIGQPPGPALRHSGWVGEPGGLQRGGCVLLDGLVVGRWQRASIAQEDRADRC